MEFEDFSEGEETDMEYKPTLRAAINVILFILVCGSLYYGIRAEHRAQLAIEAYRANAAQIDTLRQDIAKQEAKTEQISQQLKAMGEEW